MSDTSTIIVLLTITVIILSLVIVALLTVVTLLLLRLNKIAKNLESVSSNVAQATEWLTPTKVIGTVMSVFKR